MSLFIFIVIGLLAGEAGALLLEKRGKFSIRYLLTGLALATAAGTIAALVTKGAAGLWNISHYGIVAAAVTAGVGVILLKLLAKPLNAQTAADVPWSEAGDDAKQPADKGGNKKGDDYPLESLEGNWKA